MSFIHIHWCVGHRIFHLFNKQEKFLHILNLILVHAKLIFPFFGQVSCQKDHTKNKLFIIVRKVFHKQIKGEKIKTKEILYCIRREIEFYTKLYNYIR